MKWFVGLLCLWAGGVQAQSIADSVNVESPAGTLRIVDAGDGFSRQLMVGERAFFTDGVYRFVTIADQRGSLYLIGLSSGGNACEVGYVWLHTRGEVRLSPEFGTCAPLSDVRSDAETVSVLMPSMVASDGVVAFVYDGEEISEVVLGQDFAGVPHDAAKLVGRFPFELFRDAGWRPSLEAVLGADGYLAASAVIDRSTPFERQGDWVVGRGFNTRMAGNAHGAVAVHLESGRVVVAIHTEEGGVQLWGHVDGAVPEDIAQVIASE